MSDGKLNDEEELEYTKSKRKLIIEGLCADGLPKDTKDQSIVLQALDGLDRITLTKMRIKSEEGVGTANAAAAALLAELFNTPNVTKLGRTSTPVVEAPTLRDDLPTISVVPGELDASVTKDNYDNFVKRNQVE